MGTHPSLPSKDVETQRSLHDLVQDNQALMSTEISKKYGEKLPFLFKVLSIRKALSIQAHPNKKLAAQLHEKDPKNYPGMIHMSYYAYKSDTLLQMTTTNPRWLSLSHHLMDCAAFAP